MTDFRTLFHTQINIRHRITTLLRADHIDKHMVTTWPPEQVIADHRLVLPLPAGVQVVPLFVHEQRVVQITSLVRVWHHDLIGVFDCVAGVEAVDINAGADGRADPFRYFHFDHLPRRV